MGRGNNKACSHSAAGVAAWTTGGPGQKMRPPVNVWGAKLRRSWRTALAGWRTLHTNLSASRLCTCARPHLLDRWPERWYLAAMILSVVTAALPSCLAEKPILRSLGDSWTLRCCPTDCIGICSIYLYLERHVGWLTARNLGARWRC